jgi:pilus assembly protein HofN
LPCAEASSFSQLSLLIDGQSLQRCATRTDDETSFDPWRVIHRLQPPLPDCGERYAVAIGLALGAVTMTMAVILPWREARRRQRLRVTLLYAAGLLLILLTVAQVHRAERHAVEALAAVRAAAENQLSSALRQARKQHAGAAAASTAAAPATAKTALTEAWQPRLQAIAAQLPEQAWLTRLEYQRDTLMLSGLALNLNAVAGLEKALNAVAGFKPAKAGETRRGEQGRWQFRFFLSGEHADAGTH